MIPCQDIELPRHLATPADQMPSLARSNYLHTVKPSNSSKTLVVAISGCSSSGKTLLSLLLEAVFSVLHLSDCNLANFPRPSRNIIIHEDDYFLPKNSCPLVSFATTSSDDNFISTSLLHDHSGLYSFNQRNDIQTADDPKRVPLERRTLGSVMGPDTDCWEAVDLTALIMVCRSFHDLSKRLL